MPTQIPTYSNPGRNRQVLLTIRPNGIPQPEHFSLVTSDVPVPADGQILVRNIYLSADPAQRGWASAEANYSQPVPLGGPMRALAVGVVVESKIADFSSGDFVYGFFGWQDYAAVGPEAVIHRAVEALPLDAFAGLLGINGVTAYLALTRLGRPAAGETLVVSTAAGSVGSVVGQIGRGMGCRTIGITGDDEKVKRCRERFGYEVAINYKTQHIGTALDAAAPDGVNIYYDNTGGAILDTVLRRMAIAGRIVQCGTAAIPSWTPPPTGPRNEREIMTRRLVWSGFVIFDHLKVYADATARLAELWNTGAISYDVDVDHGIERAPFAIAALYSGENKGKKLIFIG